MIPSFLPENLVPEQYRAKTFVAGGYAACPSLATDCDVWVSVAGSPTLEDARQELFQHALDQNFPVRYSEEPILTEQTIADEYGELMPIVTLKVLRMLANVEGRDIEIHLMVSNGTMDEVLDCFDISTHQCAVTAQSALNGRSYKGRDWTALDVEPRILRTTPTTEDRLKKIRSRYASFREGTPSAEIF